MQNQIDKTSFLLLTNFSEKEKGKKQVWGISISPESSE